MSTIALGDTEAILAEVTDRTGAQLTGKTDLYARISRDSDKWLLDWDDLTFKAAGHTTKNKQLSERNATDEPGIYEVVGGLDTSLVTNLASVEDLVVTAVQVGGSDAVLPSSEVIQVRELEKECHLSVAYDDSTTTLEMVVWLVRGSNRATNATIASIDWYTSDGTPVFTATSSTPDANGVFEINQVITLVDNESYYAEVSITDPLGTVSTVRGVPTVG